MQQKQFNNIRFKLKGDTRDNLSKASGFVPLDKELVMIKPDSDLTYAQLMVGDGETTVSNLECINPQADWNQINSTQPDFIKNKPEILSTDQIQELITTNAPSQIQSDWNQNDSEQVDFIKNKPFGIDNTATFSPLFENVIFTTTNLSDSENPIFGYEFSSIGNLSPLYKVVLDGIEYICELKDMEGTKYIGNLAHVPLDGLIDTGEPFLVLFEDASSLFIDDVDQSTIHEASFYSNDGSAIKKIELIYLPTDAIQDQINSELDSKLNKKFGSSEIILDEENHAFIIDGPNSSSDYSSSQSSITLKEGLAYQRYSGFDNESSSSNINLTSTKLIGSTSFGNIYGSGESKYNISSEQVSGEKNNSNPFDSSSDYQYKYILSPSQVYGKVSNNNLTSTFDVSEQGLNITSDTYGPLSINRNYINASDRTFTFPSDSGTLITDVDADKKLDKNGLVWTANNTVLCNGQASFWPSKISVYDPSTKSGGFLEIGRFMVRNTSGEEAQVFADSIKHLKINSDDTKITTTLDFPNRSATSTEIIATETSVAEQLTPLKEEITMNSRRTGNWYSTEQLAAGISLNLGRFYMCTGSGIIVTDENGNSLSATDGETVADGGTKLLGLILPNTLSDQGDYRCKAIWATQSLLGSSYTSKDFVLSASAKNLIVKATAGTSIWSI